MSQLRILLLDDEPSVLQALARTLRSSTATLDLCNSHEEALHSIQKKPPSLVISDQHMPGMLGTEFLSKVQHILPNCGRMILSGYADFSDITEAFNQGIIQQFISKPWDNQQLLKLVNAYLEQTHSIGVDNDNTFFGLWSQSPTMHEMFEKVSRAALANVPVFIHGESGTGKEGIAHALHHLSARSEQPFLATNCANFTEGLMESQLFGHTKGAFTNASKDTPGLLQHVGRGSLFLDETTTLPLPLQAKLLRVLQERRYTPVGSQQPIAFNGEIISASSTSLKEACECGDFREDLRYRLEVISLDLPPLRERNSDAPNLLLRFLNARAPKRQWQLSTELKTHLEHYPWPGNVRELENLSQYLVAMSANDLLTINDLNNEIRHYQANTSTIKKTEQPLEDLATMDRSVLMQLLEQHNYNRSELARALNVSRMTLWRHCKRHNLEGKH